MDRIRGAFRLLPHAADGALLVPRDRPLPVAASIHWPPAHATAAAHADGAALPIFMTQGALAAVQDHVAAGAGAASLGLLLGSLCAAPDTGTRFLVMESNTRLPGRVAGDNATPVMTEGLAAAQPELQAASGHLAGWYHSHLLPDAALSPNDIETHQRFFEEPWQVALLVVPRDKPLGGLFRRSAGAGWANDPVPFYELLDTAAVLPNGRHVTHLAWANYRTTADTIPARDAVLEATEQAAHVRLLFPDDPDERPSLGGWPRLSRQGVVRVVRFAAYGVVGLLAAVGLVNVYELTASRWSAAARAGTPAIADPSPLGRLDRSADTLALALAAFDVRARLFERRQMGCPELARGLVVVEEWWIAYNAARKQAAALDAAHGAQDRSLYSDIDAVERRFERSRCPRP